MKLKLLILLAAILACIPAYSYDFSAVNDDGVTIYYKTDSWGKRIIVTAPSDGSKYKGCVNIPASVEYEGELYTVVAIGSSAFQKCYGLTSITIPESVYNISSEAFSYCTGLTSLTIPNSVTSIQSGAFSYCSGLTSLTIPNSVSILGSSAFERCTGLKSVTISESLKIITSETFEGCTNLTTITIPNLVTTIERYAFGSCSSLTSVTIPSSVTSINEFAFSGCSGLQSIITLNPTPPAISKYSFLGVDKATCALSVLSEAYDAYTSDNLWNEFEHIAVPCDSYSFNNDSYDTYVGIPLSLVATPEPERSFILNPSWNSSDEAVATVDQNGHVTPLSLGTTTITLTSGEISASCQVNSLPLPPSIVDDYFTTNNKDNVAIRYHKLSDNTVEVVALENGEKYIGTVEIPASVVANKYSTAQISWDGKWGAEPNSNAIGGYQYTCNSPGSNRSTVTRCTFSNASSITFTFVPNGEYGNDYLTIGYLDRQCTRSSYYLSLNWVRQGVEGVITFNVPDYGEHYVEFCYSKNGSINTAPDNATVYVSATNDRGNTIYEFDVTAIGERAFSGCTGMTSVTIPASVASVGNYAFSGCTGVKELILVDSPTALDLGKGLNINGYRYSEFSQMPIKHLYMGRNINNPASGFFHTKTIESVEFSDYVTEIPDGMFSSQMSIATVVLPKSLTKIGKSAFNSCKSLKHISIPKNVTEIGDYAFDDSGLMSVEYNAMNATCGNSFSKPNVKEVVFGPDVRQLNSTVFNQFVPTEKVTSLAALPPTCSNNTFNANIYSLPLYVPAESLSAYCTAEVWKNFTSILAIPAAGEIGWQEEVDGILYEITATDPHEVMVTRPQGNEYTGDLVIPATVEIAGEEYSVTTMSIDAIYNATGLVSVTIPATLTGNLSFPYDNVPATMMTAFNVDADNAAYTSVAGVVYDKEMTSLLFYPFAKEGDYVVPETVTSIPSMVNRTGLTSIVIGDRVTSRMANFTNCTALKSAVVGNGISYPDKAGDRPEEDIIYFTGCSELEYVEIGTGIDAFPTNAFRGASSLKTLVIRDSEKPIYISYNNLDGWNYGMLANCPITTLHLGRTFAVDYYKTNTVMRENPFYGIDGQPYIETLEIGPDVTELNSNMISKRMYGICDIYITSLEQWLGFDMSGLNKFNLHIVDNDYHTIAASEISIPDNVTSITGNHFVNCTSLAILNIHKDFTRLKGYEPRNNANNVSRLYVVANESSRALDGCDNLQEINVESGNAVYSSQDGVLLTADGTELLKFPPLSTLTEYEVPASVEYIASDAFNGAHNLTKLELGASINQLGNTAFASCSGLNSITVDNSNPANISLGSYVFSGVPTSTCTLYVPKGSKELYASANQWKNFANIEEFGSISLTDGEVYDATEDLYNVDVNYTRNFNNTEWQPLYVPFNMSYEEWAPYADVAEVHNVRGYDNNGDGEIDDIVIEFNKLSSGEIIPNVPYVIKAKNTGEVTFECTGKTLLAAPAEEGTVQCSSTKMTYSFHGVYQPKTDMFSTGAYHLSNGAFHQTTSDATVLSPNRFYLMVTPKTGGYNPTSAHRMIRMMVNGDDTTTSIEGIEVDTQNDNIFYDLMGRKVINPTQGIYIQNGRKVFVK